MDPSSPEGKASKHDDTTEDTPQSEEVEFTEGTAETVAMAAIKGEQDYSKLGLGAGLIVIGVGALLLILGITGSVDWGLRLAGLESKLSNASPGVVAMVVGLIIIFRTRPRVKITK